MNARKLTLASALVTLLGPAAAFAASPIIVDQPSAKFLDTSVGNGNILTLTYSNGSNATQTITNVALIGSAPGDFAVAPNGVLPATLAPGATFTSVVAFNPTKIGLRSATVSVSVKGQQTCDSTVSGQGTATAIPATPAPLQFGGTTLKNSIKKTVTFTNSTANLITVAGFSVSTNSAEFTANSLFNFPAQVPAGASLPIDVTFTPANPGVRLGVISLTVQNVGNPINAVLLGSSGDPQVNLGNNAVLFGNTHVGATSDPQMLSVGNIGYTDLKVLQIIIAGANPGDFNAVLPNLPATVPPGGNVMYGVTFRPMGSGSRNANVTVVTDDPNNGTVSFLVGGTGVAYNQSISPAPGMALDFGQVKAGDTSMPQSVTITNSSMAPLNITMAFITGPQASSFTFSQPPMKTVVVKAGGSASFPIVFSPKAGGVLKATASFLLDDPNTPILSADLTGSGTAGSLSCSPLQIDFGSIPLGKTSTAKSVTCTNTGTAQLMVKSAVISGADKDAFTSPDAPDMPTPLDPGETLKFVITFTPAVHAVANANVVITSDDPQAPVTNINLKAAGTQPKITVTPMSLDFGVTVAGVPTESQNVTITNSGDDTLTIDNVVVNGPAAASFKVEGWSAATPIRVGEQIIVAVRFSPVAAGSISATLTISPQGGVLAPVAVGLKGSAVSNALAIAPTTSDFGLIQVGQSSDPVTFTVQNTSPGPLVLAPLTSTNPAFTIDTSATLLTLAPGAKTSFDVVYTPTAVQTDNGLVTMALLASPKTVIAKVTLTGEGAAPITKNDNKSGCSVAAGGRGAASAPALLLVACALLLGVRRRRTA